MRCQRMLKLPHNCTHLTHQQSNAQNSPSQASTVRELRASNIQTGFRKGRRTRDQIANIHWIIEKAREFQKNIYFFIDYAKAFDCVDHSKLWKILQERWMKLEPIIQSEVSQKEKYQYSILTHIYGI